MKRVKRAGMCNVVYDSRQKMGVLVCSTSFFGIIKEQWVRQNAVFGLAIVVGMKITYAA